LYAQRTQEANIQARQMFERAFDLDPQFATAYAFLGRTYLMELIYQWSQDPQIPEQVVVFGQKAVALMTLNRRRMKRWPWVTYASA